MIRNLVAVAAIALASPALAQFNEDMLEEEIFAVYETMDSGSVTLERSLVARNVCSVDESTGDALIDNRLCMFEVDCANNNIGNPADAEACVDELRWRLAVKLARRNLSTRVEYVEDY